MVQINFAQKTVNVKIVYYGPGMSGKTTNLEIVHQRAPDKNCGELTSISTDGDRTLFFDYMPLNLGTVAGMRTLFQLYTVPGQVYYNSTRKLVLQGVDGVIFVADSSAAMLDQNIEALRNLEENLNEYGKSLATLPHVIQWNKRDLPDAMPTDELARHMNHHGAPTFEAVANTGQGVFPTLKALAASVLRGIMQETSGGARPSGGTESPAPAAPRQPARQPAVHAAPQAPARQPARQAEAPAPTPSRVRQVAAQPVPQEVVSTAAVRQQAPAVQQPSATGLMQQPQPTASARPQTRQRARQQGTAVRRARQQTAAIATKKGGASTGIFIAVAASIGAAIAWAAMNYLA